MKTPHSNRSCKSYIIFFNRGNCKTALPGKIDDFETGYKWQQSCQAPFDEVGPSWADQGKWMKMDSKGRYCWVNEFCNCLYSQTRDLIGV